MTVEELMQLPGVGRKTANVITSVIDNQPNMAVDTHVFRVANRIGLVKAKTPLETEKQLVKNLPKDLIYVSSSLANIARQIYLYCKKTEMRNLWIKAGL